MLMCSLLVVPVLLQLLFEWECSWMEWGRWSESDEGMEMGSKMK